MSETMFEGFTGMFARIDNIAIHALKAGEGPNLPLSHGHRMADAA
jgi:hypothetical protein